MGKSGAVRPVRAILFICAIAFSFFLCACTETAIAAERLHYPENISLRSVKPLEDYAWEKMDLRRDELRIATADLNRDGLPEYILHTKTCRTEKKCRYNILAETPQGIIPLGSISGKTLLLGNGFSHGVRDILSFENDLNDYDQTLYVWMPEKASYGKKDE